MQRHLTFLILAILQTVLSAATKGHYTIVAPGTLHTNRKYNVAVALHQTTEPATLLVGLVGEQYSNVKTLQMQPNIVKNIIFDVPLLPKGDYNLTAEGVAGLIFKNTTKLNYNEFTSYVKIQTDRGIYKPGDVVKFRVLFLDENLKPSEPTPSTIIWFEDGKRNRIKEYKNISVTKGVYTNKFQISDYPVLGKWRLTVDNGGWRATIVSFDVAKYVLPKFKVNVEATSHVSVKDGDMQAVVRANYTYGKPVNGKVTMLVALQSYHHLQNNNNNTNRTPAKIIKTGDMVNGKAKFDFTVKQYAENFNDFRTAPLVITAIVEENFTGVKINGTTRTTLHRDRYAISCTDYRICNSFKADQEMAVILRVLLVDGATLQDTKSVVKLRLIDVIDKHYYREDSDTLPEPKIEHSVLEFESNLNASSLALFRMTLPSLTEYKGYTHYFRMQADFKDETHNISSLYQLRPPKQVTANADTESKPYFNAHIEYAKGRYGFNISEPFILTINSSVALTYFDYNIICRGNILINERVFVPNSAKTYDLSLIPTFAWSPYARFYAFYVDEHGEFHYAETVIQVNVELQNKLEISAPSQTKPGENVNLRIKTTPNSFVGLLAVDQSVLLLGHNNDIAETDFRWRLGSYSTFTPWQGGYSRYPGGQTGVVTLTNANYFYNYTPPYHGANSFDFSHENVMVLRSPAVSATTPLHVNKISPVSAAAVKGGASNKENAVRSDFSETWIFADIEDTQTSEFTWTKKIPDTITSWALTGFALHADKGLGVTSHKTNIVTFQPFFISVRLPYSVKRGEVINVPALVFNYLDKDLDVEITLDNTDGEYEFTEVSNEIISDSTRVKSIRVAAQSTGGVAFMLRPKIIGNIMLKYTATSPIAGDAIHKTLKVVPEGVTEYANRAYFVNLKDTAELRHTFDLVLPEEVVPDSEYIEFSVVGDILGPILNNLDHLLRLPTGCAEQTISTLVPNYLALQHLKNTKRLTTALESKILHNLGLGYQRLLKYRLADSSFATFLDKERHVNGSIWLTAYVVRSLQQLTPLLNIDNSIVEKGLKYLANKQAQNGSYVENYHIFFGAERQEAVALTAHVLLTFLENEEFSTLYQTNIDNGFKFILENIDKTNNLYAKVLATYTLQKARHPLASKQFDTLKSAIKSDEDRMWWSAAEHQPKHWWHWTHNSDVEITSYMLLTLLDMNMGSVDNLLPIVKWLVAQRNSYGGFISTQDTVVGLQALIEFAKNAQYEPAIMDIEVTSKGHKEQSEIVKITEDNALLLQSVQLPNKTNAVDFNAQGKGAALVQIAYQYNVLEKDPKPSFTIQTVIKKDTPILKLEMDVCVEYTGEGSGTNMALLEISLPSGYVADVEAFEHIGAVSRVRLVESQKSDTLIVVYFESLPKGEIQCLPIEALRQYAVAHQKPASIMLYDYYYTARRAIEYYQVVSKLCDICEDDIDCRKACQ